MLHIGTGIAIGYSRFLNQSFLKAIEVSSRSGIAFAMVGTMNPRGREMGI